MERDDPLIDSDLDYTDGENNAVKHDYFFRALLTLNNSVDDTDLRKFLPHRLRNASVSFHSPTPKCGFGFGCVTNNKKVCKESDLAFIRGTMLNNTWRYPIPDGTVALFLCTALAEVADPTDFRDNVFLSAKIFPENGLLYRRLTKRIHIVLGDAGGQRFFYGMIAYPAFADDDDSLTDQQHQEAFAMWDPTQKDSDCKEFVAEREEGHVLLHSTEPIPFDYEEFGKKKERKMEWFTKKVMGKPAVRKIVEDCSKKIKEELKGERHRLPEQKYHAAIMNTISRIAAQTSASSAPLAPAPTPAPTEVYTSIVYQLPKRPDEETMEPQVLAQLYKELESCKAVPKPIVKDTPSMTDPRTNFRNHCEQVAASISSSTESGKFTSNTRRAMFPRDLLLRGMRIPLSSQIATAAKVKTMVLMEEDRKREEEKKKAEEERKKEEEERKKEEEEQKMEEEEDSDDDDYEDEDEEESSEDDYEDEEEEENAEDSDTNSEHLC